MDAIDTLGERMQAAAGQLDTLSTLSGRFATTIGNAFAGGIARGKSFDDVLRGVGQRLEQIALQAAFKPLGTLASQGIGAAVSALTGGFSGLGGGGAGTLTPFADGGVVAAPSYFPMPGGLGVAGEAGPEAILPLARGADGRLGVRAGGGTGSVSVTVNVSTPDVEGFRRSQAQVSAAIARAVARGRRAM